MERVLVIAGGEWQTPLVKKVKERGYQVIDSNLYQDSPAFAYADITEVADVLDMEKNLEIARKHRIDAVITDESDIAVPTVAYVAEELNLPGIGTDMALLYTNKYKMREFCRTHGLPTPQFFLCKSKEDAIACVSRVSQKVVIKPLDSQSSRGVFVLEKPEDAMEHYDISASYSRDKESVIVEKYIQGKEFTVDGIVVDGKHYTLAISEKRHFSYNPSIASELFFSYENPDFDYDKLRRQNDRLVELTGLPFGLTHAEYKYNNGTYYLIEIAARGGGTRISSHIVPLLCGVDNYGMFIDMALGHQIQEIPSKIYKSYQTCAVLKFLDLPSEGGLVTDISGVEEIRNDPHIVELRLEFQKGDILPPVQDDRSRPGFYIAWGENREELLKIMARVEKTIKITVQKETA